MSISVQTEKYSILCHTHNYSTNAQCCKLSSKVILHHSQSTLLLFVASFFLDLGPEHLAWRGLTLPSDAVVDKATIKKTMQTAFHRKAFVKQTMTN